MLKYLLVFFSNLSSENSTLEYTFDDFKNTPKNVKYWFLIFKNMCRLDILSRMLKCYSWFNILRQNTNNALISLGQNKHYKKCALFFHNLQLITVLFLVRDSYMSWSTRFMSLKVCVGFWIFDAVSLHQSLRFCSTKSMDSFTLKRHNFFWKIEQKKSYKKSYSQTICFWVAARSIIQWYLK